MRVIKEIVLVLAIAFASINCFAGEPQTKGWSVKQIADGINYYSFSGIEEVSKSAQQVFVIDWDTTNPSYALHLTWTDHRQPTSDIFRLNDAMATINGAYEPESTAICVGGHLYSCMPKDTVMTTPVPNWKSEGALFVDNNGGNVGISFSGNGKSIQEQRAFYAGTPWENFFTSAPMLIEDYNPVGAFFVDSTLTQEQLITYDYEDPIRHQGVRHPRTAVALTEDGHFLMIAVDGRREGVSEGMSARELTRFIELNFHPQYALNMDGGGSTTMCVRGEGDPLTHVVNYPTGNKLYDHAGERKLFSHICLVERPVNNIKDVREKVKASDALASGLEMPYDCTHKAQTPAPKGYEPVYIGHYGRHGSRYAYTSTTYSYPLEMLREGAQKGILTERGQKLLNDLEVFWNKCEYQVGDLTTIGWNQQNWIAQDMVKNFPQAFKKGSKVDACSSSSVRSIMSMASFCLGVAKAAPKADIYEHQGILDIQATRPNQGKNPFIYRGPKTIFPYHESSADYFYRRFPGYMDVLGRLFTDPVAGLGARDASETFFYYYMFLTSMANVPEENRVDISGLVTAEEKALLWETDGFERYREYLPYRTPCSSIVEDIIAKADSRLASGSRGADLRFGHDHVMMALLMIMNIDGFGYIPPVADDYVNTFQTFRSPKAANLQFVFYTPKCKKSAETLVKVLLNGEEVSLGTLKAVSGPYYEWSAVKEYLNRRINLFVTK